MSEWKTWKVQPGDLVGEAGKVVWKKIVEVQSDAIQKVMEFAEDESLPDHRKFIVIISHRDITDPHPQLSWLRVKADDHEQAQRSAQNSCERRGLGFFFCWSFRPYALTLDNLPSAVLPETDL